MTDAAPVALTTLLLPPGVLKTNHPLGVDNASARRRAPLEAKSLAPRGRRQMQTKFVRFDAERPAAVQVRQAVLMAVW